MSYVYVDEVLPGDVAVTVQVVPLEGLQYVLLCGHAGGQCQDWFLIFPNCACSQKVTVVTSNALKVTHQFF